MYLTFYNTLFLLTDHYVHIYMTYNTYTIRLYNIKSYRIFNVVTFTLLAMQNLASSPPIELEHLYMYMSVCACVLYIRTYTVHVHEHLSPETRLYDIFILTQNF